MTHAEQKRFMNGLISNVRKSLLDNINKHPLEWDGHELRRLIAERFALADISDLMNGKRARDYRNEVLVRNIL